MYKILIVEDDISINNLIYKNFKLIGYDCSQSFDGKDALSKIENNCFDIIILDVMLPYISGFDLIKKINIPVIFLTAKGRIEDLSTGLRLGAWDYIVKPFKIAELIERVNSVLRRTKNFEHKFSFDDIVIDFDSKKVYKQKKEVFLTYKEYGLLIALVENINIALSRNELLEKVWGDMYDGDERTIDIHIRRLRAKLGLEERLKTIFKVGYRLEI